MKILFLDVDGVLNSQETFRKRHAAYEAAKAEDAEAVLNEHAFPLGHLDTDLIERLNVICERTGCHIVVSSTWRITRTPEEVAELLTQKGFRYGNVVIDRTGRNADDRRGGEIQDWLDKHPEVTHYVILDDDTADIIGDYTDKKHPNNFVHTDHKLGLQDADVERAILILTT